MSVTVAIPRTDLKYLDGLQTERILQDDAMINATVTIPTTKENFECLVKMLVASKKEASCKVINMPSPYKNVA